MPRLTEDQIKAGLLHDDIDVRTAVLRYFTDGLSTDSTVMPVVIQALDRFGRDKTFRHSFRMAELSQTHETIRWAIDELQTNTAGRKHRDVLIELLCAADPRLVSAYETEIMSIRRPGGDAQAQVARRLRLLTLNEEDLWRELEAICEEGKAKNHFDEVRWQDGEDVAEELGRRPVRPIDRLMHLLEQTIDDYDNSPFKWMEPLAIRLAGEWKHEPAIPLIIAKLRADVEGNSEECVDALVRIGNDDVVRAVHRDYAAAKWPFRLFSTGVFERVHRDSAVEAIIDVLPCEKAGDLIMFLGNALVYQFSTDANEAARKLVIDDPSLTDVRNGLLVSCALTGQDFTELAGWKKEREHERREQTEWQQRIDNQERPLPPLARTPRSETALPAPALKWTSPKVGRNDPCPCGSGKKHKHCCLNKSRSPI